MLQRFTTPFDNSFSDPHTAGSVIDTIDKKPGPHDAQHYDVPEVPLRLQGKAHSRGDGAFLRFPDVVIRNKHLSAEGLFILAFRATFKGDFALREEVFAGESASTPIAREGFGINVCRRAIGECKKLSYLKRWQVVRPGSYGEVKERVYLPGLGNGGLQGVHVKRRWFNATLSVKEMAAFLFTRAGTGRGPDIYVREVAERFDWSVPTARKILNALEQFGLVEKIQRRDERGRVLAAVYQPLRSPAWKIWRRRPAGADDTPTIQYGEVSAIRDKKACNSPLKNPCIGLPCDGNPRNLHTTPLHSLKAPWDEEPQREHTIGHSSHRRSADNCDQEVDQKHLLAGVEQAFANFNVNTYFDDVAGESIDEICEVADESTLRKYLRAATGRRINPDLLTVEGLNAVRMVAAIILSHDGCEADEALRYVLEFIFEKIGKHEGVWLDSMSAIAARIIAERY